MKLPRDIADWARSMAGAIWRIVAPQAGSGVAGGAAADLARSRRELVLENARLRHQIMILRRQSPHPKLTTLDRLRLLVAAAVLPSWRRALAIVGQRIPDGPANDNHDGKIIAIPVFSGLHHDYQRAA